MTCVSLVCDQVQCAKVRLLIGCKRYLVEEFAVLSERAKGTSYVYSMCTRRTGCRAILSPVRPQVDAFLSDWITREADLPRVPDHWRRFGTDKSPFLARNGSLLIPPMRY